MKKTNLGGKERKTEEKADLSWKSENLILRKFKGKERREP